MRILLLPLIGLLVVVVILSIAFGLIYLLFFFSAIVLVILKILGYIIGVMILIAGLGVIGAFVTGDLKD